MRLRSAAYKAAVGGYGGEIIECEPTQAAREAAIAELVAASGAEEIHPFNDARVIAGQGTCALELIEQVEGLDCVVTPVGGGGLISGTCLTLSARAPAIEIYGAEPENADDARRSCEAGELVEIATPQTVADGLKTNLKPMTWQFIRDHAKGVLVASEEQILDAMYLTWERMKIIIEPSSAVPLAAMLRNPEVFHGRRVGIVVTGGNVDLKNCPGCK
jgi:threonine dehydratase